MKETLDVRLDEDWARAHLPKNIGQPMRIAPLTGNAKLDEEIQQLCRPLTRQLLIDTSDPLVQYIRDHINKRDQSPSTTPLVYSSVLLTRTYTRQEKDAATAFHIWISSFFEPAGVDAGTEYDYSGACPTCGFGRIRRSGLTLTLTNLPSRAGIARTIAWDEWIVSRQLVDVLYNHNITGWEARPIYKRRNVPHDEWFELVIVGQAGSISPNTQIAIDYFHDDPNQEYVCPAHGWLGRWMKSELILRPNSRGADLAVTDERVGFYGGVLFPPRLIVASPRALEVLEANKVKGFRWERVLYDQD